MFRPKGTEFLIPWLVLQKTKNPIFISEPPQALRDTDFNTVKGKEG